MHRPARRRFRPAHACLAAAILALALLAPSAAGAKATKAVAKEVESTSLGRTVLANLGTIKRPEGKTQVTFKGLPLYTFAADTKPGEAKGEGIKDVGTWHAATLARRQTPPAEPQPAEPPYPY